MPASMDRRRFITWLSSAGLAAVAAPALVRGQPAEAVTDAAIAEAARLFGITFTSAERELMLSGVKDHLENYEALRALGIENEVPPALTFSAALPEETVPAPGKRERPRTTPPRLRPGSTRGDAVAFLPLTELGGLLRRGDVTSVELTRMYLRRLEQHDPRLRCVITLTADRALRQARRADDELRRGVDRGPLHGIPWGAKDLLAVRGYRTTWGAMPYKDQIIDTDAEVVRRLDEAGAVLVAKLSVGALAWGDVWFDATTKNPWNLEQGSSGSSAGPAAAAVAGLVGFSIGTETLGSIISPSQRCGATGLRPTFGRVSRDGCMALSWSMDKIGPIGRSVEDCALVFDAIHGASGGDAAAVDAPFAWDAARGLDGLRIGYQRAAFEEDTPDRASDKAAVAALRRMGVNLVPVTLPDLPSGDMLIILEAEAAAAFDRLTLGDGDDALVRQVEQAWPNVFRSARLIPAVEYIQANRARTLLMRAFEEAVSGVDAFVHPTYAGGALVAANLTGHPAVAVPNGFRADGTPTSISFTGRRFREAELLSTAKEYQDRTGFHRRHPPGFGV